MVGGHPRLGLSAAGGRVLHVTCTAGVQHLADHVARDVPQVGLRLHAGGLTVGLAKCLLCVPPHASLGWCHLTPPSSHQHTLSLHSPPPRPPHPSRKADRDFSRSTILLLVSPLLPPPRVTSTLFPPPPLLLPPPRVTSTLFPPTPSAPSSKAATLLVTLCRYSNTTSVEQCRRRGAKPGAPSSDNSSSGLLPSPRQISASPPPRAQPAPTPAQLSRLPPSPRPSPAGRPPPSPRPSPTRRPPLSPRRNSPPPHPSPTPRPPPTRPPSPRPPLPLGSTPRPRPRPLLPAPAPRPPSPAPALPRRPSPAPASRPPPPAPRPHPPSPAASRQLAPSPAQGAQGPPRGVHMYVWCIPPP